MAESSVDEVVRPAAAPEADLACDLEFASAERAYREQLAAAMIGGPRAVNGGVEVTVRDTAWDLVLKYFEAESQCCPFLHLAARRSHRRIVLSVTGRDDAQPLIAQIFATPAD